MTGSKPTRIYTTRNYISPTRDYPTVDFVEPARLEGANGEKDLQSQKADDGDVDWSSGPARRRSAGGTDEPLLEPPSDDPTET